MIDPDACDRVLLRVLYNGTTKTLFITKDAIDHCGGMEWFREFCEAYNLRIMDYDDEREGYPVELTTA
jgi:hypothetical protein